MNQDKRNKKNAQYQANLQKRNGLTKSDEYKKICSGVFGNTENQKNLKHEFLTTRRHGKIVTRELYLYTWTKEAKDAQEEYHKTKNGIPAIPAKPKEKLKKLSKKELLETRSFSGERSLMIAKAFSKVSNALRKMAEKSAHEVKIENMIAKLKQHKLDIQQKNNKNMPYKFTIVYQNDKQQLYDFSTHYVNNKLDVVANIASDMNKKLSKEAEKYHHISVKDNFDNDKVLMIFTPDQLSAA